MNINLTGGHHTPIEVLQKHLQEDGGSLGRFHVVCILLIINWV